MPPIDRVVLAQLRSSRRLEDAIGSLRDYRPYSDDQAREQERMLAFCREHPDAALRSCAPGHLTASALVLDASGRRGLFTLHRKLGLWLQLGGHCDGETNLARAALLEAIEESGIDELRIDPKPIDVDIHTIPARKGEPEHLHLDTRFVVWAPAGAREICSDESLELRWIDLGALDALDTDNSVRRLARRIPEAKSDARSEDGVLPPSN